MLVKGGTGDIFRILDIWTKWGIQMANYMFMAKAVHFMFIFCQAKYIHWYRQTSMIILRFDASCENMNRVYGQSSLHASISCLYNDNLLTMFNQIWKSLTLFSYPNSLIVNNGNKSYIHGVRRVKHVSVMRDNNCLHWQQVYLLTNNSHKDFEIHSNICSV